MFKLSLQYILPKLWLTRLAGWGASKRVGWLTKLVIDLFVKYYKVDIKGAQKPDTVSYRTLNEFSVRPLHDEVHPIDIDPNVLVMPADGVTSQLGKTEEDKVLQAKGHNYSPEALLAGNYLMADLFHSGTFVTIYLSPHNYHRIHTPCNGILCEMIYVPGDLFFVNHLTAQNVLNLFARNGRVICLSDIEFGPMAQILVGAMVVGSIGTVWAGTITPSREDIIRRWTWLAGENDGSVALLKGQEMGRSKLDSIVINLFASGKVNLVEQLESLSVTKIGQPLAVSTETSATPDAEPAPLPAEEIEAEHDASPLVDDRKDQVQSIKGNADVRLIITSLVTWCLSWGAYAATVPDSRQVTQELEQVKVAKPTQLEIVETLQSALNALEKRKNSPGRIK